MSTVSRVLHFDKSRCPRDHGLTPSRARVAVRTYLTWKPLPHSPLGLRIPLALRIPLGLLLRLLRDVFSAEQCCTHELVRQPQE